MRARIQTFDHACMLAIARRRHPALTVFFRVLTITGQGWWWAFVVVALWLGIHFDFLRFPQRELYLRATIAPGIAWIFVQSLKLVFRRRRPFQILPDYGALSVAPSDDSFPSGHTSSVFAFFVATLPLGLPATAIIGAWAGLVSFSRYYLGVHFPSDILVGAVIGSLAGASLGGITHAIGGEDRYPSYGALALSEREGKDFIVETRDRGSEFLVMAIHGGNLERGSDQLAKRIAGSTWNDYLFRVTKPGDPVLLHVTSTHFDDPRLVRLAEKSRVCVSVHGYREATKETVCLGGGNRDVRAKVEHELRRAFPNLELRIECESIAGTNAANIVNRCREKGVQLELSQRLRDRMLAEPLLLPKFADAVRKAVEIAPSPNRSIPTE